MAIQILFFLVLFDICCLDLRGFVCSLKTSDTDSHTWNTVVDSNAQQLLIWMSDKILQNELTPKLEYDTVILSF